MNCSYGQMIDATPPLPSSSRTAICLRCERTSVRVTADGADDLQPSSEKSSRMCDNHYISSSEREAEGRVTGPVQYYALIGHNIYWELVKMHAYD